MIRCDVAVVGGGFTGCMVAAQLARRTVPNLALTLFEPGELGRGAAYGTRHCEHLLNTRARAMSAFPEDPQHFVRWLGSRAHPDEFVSRQLYGDYLAEIARRAFEHPRFSVVRDRVATIERSGDGFVLETAAGTRFASRAVVLATGNPLPEDDFLPRAIVEHPGYVADPWRFDYRRVGGHVLLVGSGLTALDALVALEASGHRGAVYVVSRHGRLPETHADAVVPYDVVPAIDTSGARAALRAFRRHVHDARARGFDWRAVVDAIRPETEALWRRLPHRERERFERHLRGTWERHRHRAPQRVAGVFARYREAGRLFAHVGRIGAGAGVVSVCTSEGGRTTLRPDWIVNCTGAGRARRALREPLFARLLAAGAIAPEPLGYGMRVDDDYVALDARGARVEGLWIAGPMVRGTRFEATAVPELRAMADAVADSVVDAATSELTLTG